MLTQEEIKDILILLTSYSQRDLAVLNSSGNQIRLATLCIKIREILQKQNSEEKI